MSMKKTTVLLVILMVVASSMNLFSGKKEKEALYLAAITEQDLEVKLQKLEEYYEKYGKKKKYQTAPMFIHLVETTYKLKQYEKLLQYAELALNSKKLSEVDVINVKLKLAYYNLYSKKDFETAESLADEIIKFGEAMKNPSFDKMYTVPARRVKIAILDAQSKDLPTTLKALGTSLNAYNIDKSAQSANFVFYFSKKMYNQYSRYDDAIKALETICAAENAQTEHLDQLASWYMQDGFDDKAVKYISLSYEKEKNSQKAYYIGKLTYNNNIDKGLRHLAEAYVLGEAPYAQQALELLKEAYEETKDPGQTPEESEAAIQKIIREARTRLNK